MCGENLLGVIRNLTPPPAPPPAPKYGKLKDLDRVKSPSLTITQFFQRTFVMKRNRQKHEN